MLCLSCLVATKTTKMNRVHKFEHNCIFPFKIGHILSSNHFWIVAPLGPLPCGGPCGHNLLILLTDTYGTKMVELIYKL